jgi:hypothetical protein
MVEGFVFRAEMYPVTEPDLVLFAELTQWEGELGGRTDDGRLRTRYHLMSVPLARPSGKVASWQPATRDYKMRRNMADRLKFVPRRFLIGRSLLEASADQ